MNTNPLLINSELPYGAPHFAQIEVEHYLPAFEEAIKMAKAEIDAIASQKEVPTFENTIEALEYSAEALGRVSGIFFNLLEADSNDEMQKIAEDVSPLLTEFDMYVSLNEPLFKRVKAVYDAWKAGDDSLKILDRAAQRLLEDTYKSFTRKGANLSTEDRKKYSGMVEELSLLELQFGKNVLDATNAFTLHLTDESDLEGLPDFVREGAAESAASKGLDGWLFDLTAPSFRPFMKYSARRELRQKLYMAYNTRATGVSVPGCEKSYDNRDVVRRIVSLRLEIAGILGYEDYASYALECRMAKDSATVLSFLDRLMVPSLPAARNELHEILDFAIANGFESGLLMPWDFSYWSEKYRDEKYALSDEMLKPYFRLENCIDAVFDLAHKLYGLNFSELKDIPVYHPDVKVYDVTDENGEHLSLFYADFFPRESKRGGAWMTEFRGVKVVKGVEQRPFISIVTNFTKPAAGKPSLITHDELTTFLHEFGHSLHGMLGRGRYESQTGTNVARDFVELPSQILENWAFEPEFLNGFARHYQTGEPIPQALIDRLVASKNYLAAYLQVRQLHFGILDMAWHTLKDCSLISSEKVIGFEKDTLKDVNVLPSIDGCCISTSFNHIFSGGYSAGYYSYKWAEVLEADAFSLFQEKGIFSKEAADAFKDNILTRGSSEDEAELYLQFRGHNPDPDALLDKLGIKHQ